MKGFCQITHSLQTINVDRAQVDEDLHVYLVSNGHSLTLDDIVDSHVRPLLKTGSVWPPLISRTNQNYFVCGFRFSESFFCFFLREMSSVSWFKIEKD